jgi:2,4-dienoyl-CoA reductase-like NADH-dependent reductase (Old Yellow Enzyme family)
LGVCDTIIDGTEYKQLTIPEIQKITAEFAQAAVLCRTANCDGVQIHSSHGYLLNTFLSPYFNKRTDEYGGPIENRARFHLEVYRAIRKAVGQDYAVAIKIPFSDLVTPSVSPEDCLWICRELAKEGINLIEISSGITHDGGATSFSPHIKDEAHEAPFRPGAALIAENVSVPVASVCGYRTPEILEKTLNETKISAISLCRPLLREPNLPNRWKTDPSKAACISCNRCYTSREIIDCQAKK